MGFFERAQRYDWDTGEYHPAGRGRHVGNLLAKALGGLWMAAWIGAALVGVVYAGLFEIGWWALAVLVFPALVFLGSLRYR